MEIALNPSVEYPQGRNAPIAPTAQHVAFLAGLLFCLTGWASAPTALAIGAILALLLPNPFSKAWHKAAKWLLQGCIVLLGFNMNLPIVLRAGESGALFAAGGIALTLVLGYALSKLLHVNARTAALISGGTAICGGSAIAAIGSVIDAGEADMTVAMGVVFLLNAAALYLFPPIGHALHLSGEQFGMWAGVAIHDVSSVVGGASRYGLDSLQTATAVKLSRTLWIVPLTLVFAFRFGKGKPGIANSTVGFDAARQSTPRRMQIPWFIAFFLLASVCRSFIPMVVTVAPALSHLATRGLTLTLFLIGTGLSTATLKSVGWRALAQGAILWIIVSALSLLVILKI